MNHYLRIESRLNNVTMFYKKGKNGFHAYPFGRVSLTYEDAKELFLTLYNEPRTPYHLPKYVRAIAELKPLNLRINDPYTWDGCADVVISILDDHDQVIQEFEYIGKDGATPTGMDLSSGDDQNFCTAQKTITTLP